MQAFAAAQRPAPLDVERRSRSPGQPGGKTWSQRRTAARQHLYGGGSMWESPIIDTKLNLAIFGTGNPVPWNSRGPGMNL